MSFFQCDQKDDDVFIDDIMKIINSHIIKSIMNFQVKK